MRTTPAQREKAKQEGEVIFDCEFDFRFVPQDQNPVTRSIRVYGTMPLERARRIRAILNEEQ